MRRVLRFIVGTFAVIGLLVVAGLIGAVWGFSALHDKVEPALPKKMVLTLDLESKIHETASADPFAMLSGKREYVLRELVQALDAAARDPQVAGLFATIGQTHLSMAEAQEIRAAVGRFKESGKQAVLFAESMGEFGNGTLAVYVASAFGKVWLQPSGDVGLTGFAAESPFLRGTLDMLGIQPQVVARKEYKTAPETFTEKRYSPAQAETLNGLLDSWSDQVIQGIAESRKMPAEKVRALFGKGPFLAAEALSAGLVDHLGYRDEAWGAAAFDSKIKKVDLAAYGARQPKASGTKVAVITGSGTIVRGDEESPFGTEQGFHAGTIAQAFRDAVEDPAVKAIILRIDSPGGSYVASDTIWNEVRRARAAGKPVVASMGGAAASGGYFVAMGADRIVAQPGTITGSIGVFSGKAVLTEFWQKLGVSWDELHRGDNATMWSTNSAFSPQALERVNAMMDHIYADFTHKAADGRKIAQDKIESVARGRVWSGADAKNVGLVDVLGGWNTTLEQVREVAGLERDAPVKLVAFPEPKKPWEMLGKVLGGGLASDESTRAMARIARIIVPVADQMDILDPQAGTLRMPVRP
ncbi:Protease(Signal peptide peptidase) [Magnetospirillum sp. LM-5]|uniref:signal peptide peptidase SppA n=1 Tax=Magnetospirillum sp. LM-5 TaxID=2681466 RepID=UPI001384ADE4|nr:signal peptide peptidase SppA [Magnetospirillum sp. LM-5]CAA7614257.1 Protease(Signal peptide peptidase) [Magnetospirillum sp. LM-5]